MKKSLVVLWIIPALLCVALARPASVRHPLDPRGEIHMPIGVPDSLDSLKTFVEPEGCFSPGFATYGVYVWVYDQDAGKLISPLLDGAVTATLSLGYPVPVMRWNAGGVSIQVKVDEVRYPSPAGEVFVVPVEIWLRNWRPGDARRRVYVALRPLGPAGGPVHELSVSEKGDALLVDGHPAVVARTPPTRAGVLPTDTIADRALAGDMPAERAASSVSGNCSGALCFDFTVRANEIEPRVAFLCPVLPGRRAVAHRWDGKNPWAQLDEAAPNPKEDGVLQPDPGLAFYRGIEPRDLMHMGYWKSFFQETRILMPLHPLRWDRAFTGIAGHAALTMNEGAPDVAVVNYNVFNRDGVYMANIFQKIGRFDFSEKAIDYFLAHPFNGRIYPEADNPGQVLWIMGEHWKFTRDRKWLERVYPLARQLAKMIQYYRTTPGPHWVNVASLDFGDALPAEKRQELEPGRCDGKHPEYTEAFDLAGMRAAATLAQAMGESRDASDWSELAEMFFGEYDRKFGANLRKEYGSYSVLWPCRIYPVSEGKAFEQFREIGMQDPSGWRYFPLATAHQGLLAGNREAGNRTIDKHLEHPQMRGWYLFDEGGKSGAGGWRFARTTWNGDVAMPHGWAIAELWLLMRDSLAFEDGDRLVLFAGIPPQWFESKESAIGFEGLATHFGKCSVRWDAQQGTLRVSGAKPPAGYVLRAPKELNVRIRSGENAIERQPNGDFLLPPEEKEYRVEFY